MTRQVTFGKYTYELISKVSRAEVNKKNRMDGIFMENNRYVAIWKATRDGMNFTVYEKDNGEFCSPAKVR